jgi:hypothetical protein
VPIAITWCPLCGSAVGVIREFDGHLTEFGVSGLLYNSDLVFYDRRTGTLWDQIEATGIVGPLTGRQLELVPITMTRWVKWKSAHPDTLVLSADTGFNLDYSRDVYDRYRRSNSLMFPVRNRDNTIRQKTVVFGFQLGDKSLAVTEGLLQESTVLEHTLGQRQYVITLADDGAVTMTDPATGSSHAPIRLFWFAWYTFNPDTELLH